jgi:hypothetical protein
MINIRIKDSPAARVRIYSTVLLKLETLLLWTNFMADITLC